MAVVVALGLALVPLLAALVSEAWLAGARPTPHGDQAIIEIHLRAALRGMHLLGPSSQYGWFHPGPLLYYVLAPLYLLSGGASESLYVGAGVINVAAVAAAAAVHFKLDPQPRSRLAFCVLLTACVAAFAARPPERAFVAGPLTEIWNPALTVLPFALLLVTAAAVSVGRLELLPLATFLHAFTAQSHISYVPCSTVVLVLALGCGLFWSRTHATGFRWRRWLATSSALALLLWLPPLVAVVRGQAGNAVDVAGFFVSDAHARLGVRGLAYALKELHWPLLTLLGVAGSGATALAAVFTAAQLAGTIAALGATARREQPYFAALTVVVAVSTLVAVVQATQLMSEARGVYYYQTLWYSVLGCLGWSGAVLTLSRVLATSRRSAALTAGLVALAAVSELVALHVVKRDVRRCLVEQPRRPEPALLVAAAVKPLFDARAGKPRYELDAVSDGAWGVLATTVLQLSKEGVTVRLAKPWRPFLGSGADYAERSPATVQLSLEPLHTAPLWQTFDGIGLYLPRRERAESRAALSVTEHASGVTVPLPAAGDGELIAGIELEADGNDAYLVEAAPDAETYVRLGVIESVHRRGARSRDFYFNDRVVWKAVRLSRLHGRGALVAVRPLVRAGSLTEPFPWATPR